MLTRIADAMVEITTMFACGMIVFILTGVSALLMHFLFVTFL